MLDGNPVACDVYILALLAHAACKCDTNEIWIAPVEIFMSCSTKLLQMHFIGSLMIGIMWSCDLPMIGSVLHHLTLMDMQVSPLAPIIVRA